MTLLTVVQDASVKIGIARPTQIVASTDRTMYDVRALIAESVDALLNAHDWQILQGINTYTGDAVTQDFDLPADYARMLKTASVWSSRYKWAMNHVVDKDTWLELVTLPYTQVSGSWCIYGNQFHILDTMASAETAKFFYISNQIVESAGGSAQTGFMADDDTFLLDEELLRLCFIWKWKHEKGRDYAEDLANYEDKLYKTIDKDNGSKPIVTGRFMRSWRQRNIAWPGNVTAFPG